MAKTALDEKDNTCGNCYLYSDKLGVCLLKGEEVAGFRYLQGVLDRL